KGRNRPWFLSRLTRSIRAALRGLKVTRVQALIGRIVITLEDVNEWDEVRGRLSRLPGIGNFALAHHVPMDLHAVTAAVVEAVAGRSAASFRVRARRADKRFPVPTPEIERHI